ncbi:MAG: D-alanine--D-alanine ligase family protein [Gemmatimonadaceae bacterium]
MKKLRVLVLMHPDMVPPDDAAQLSEEERFAFKTEWDVIRTLRKLGHETRALGVQTEFQPIRDALDEFKPSVAFNLLEEFHGNVLYDQNVVSLLELLRVPYTGCNPRGLIISREKSLAKKLLLYHRIRVPAFHVFPLGHQVKRPRALAFPLIVKSLTEHASLGISKASLVNTDEELAERVAMVHRRVATHALAEQFIAGREVYVGVIGNERLTALPTRELVFGNAAPDEPLIATERAKHNLEYQKKHGIDQKAADDLPPNVASSIGHLSKRIYRILGLTGYARLDYRLANDGQLWFLEANPNPEIALGEEFASAAKQAGMEYPDLLQRITTLGLKSLA